MSDKEFNALTVLEQREARYFRVRFRRPIAAVNSDMQPKVMKEYILKAVGSLNAQPEKNRQRKNDRLAINTSQ